MSNKESTSYISNISYEIENMLAKGKTFDEIKAHIEDLQDKEKFPPNLEFVGAHFDEKYAMSICAFMDVNRGEKIDYIFTTNYIEFKFS